MEKGTVQNRSPGGGDEEGTRSEKQSQPKTIPKRRLFFMVAGKEEGLWVQKRELFFQ